MLVYSVELVMVSVDRWGYMLVWIQEVKPVYVVTV